MIQRAMVLLLTSLAISGLQCRAMQQHAMGDKPLVRRSTKDSAKHEVHMSASGEIEVHAAKTRVGSYVNGATAPNHPNTWNTSSSTSKCLFTLTISRQWGDDNIVDVQGEPGDTFTMGGCEQTSETACMVRKMISSSGSWYYKDGWCAHDCIEDCLEDGKCTKSEDGTVSDNGGANKIMNQNGEVVGYDNCCRNPSEVVAQAVQDCVPSWPQCGVDNSKCTKIGEHHTVDSRAHCEAEAEAAGHKYYNFQEEDGLCSTASTCTTPKAGTTPKPWKIYNNEATWEQLGEDNSKCTADKSAQHVVESRQACECEAIGEGHRYYAYWEAQKKCSTHVDCDSPKTNTKQDWKIYHNPAAEEEEDGS